MPCKEILTKKITSRTLKILALHQRGMKALRYYPFQNLLKIIKWIIDFGHTSHMFPNQSWFSSIKWLMGTKCC